MKFRNAEEKKRYLENQASWEKIKAKYGTKDVKLSKRSPLSDYKLAPPAGRELVRLPSLSTTSGDNSASLRTSPKYTGDKVLGVTIIHKSCLQPVFSQQEAVEAASMRR